MMHIFNFVKIVLQDIRQRPAFQGYSFSGLFLKLA